MKFDGSGKVGNLETIEETSPNCNPGNTVWIFLVYFWGLHTGKN
jgi:hypothetical protein